MGRICYEAFRSVQEGRQSILDWPSVNVARQILAMLVGRKDFYSVVALRDGRVVGSNFLSLMDRVAGVGPITVDPSLHGQGTGRALMQDVLKHAKRNRIARVRLFQDGFNADSLSLYASLGFKVREPAAVMQASPSMADDGVVRPATEADLERIDQLSKEIYKISRRNEVASALRYGFTTFVSERRGNVSGYLTAGTFGHGVAESEAEAVALVAEVGRLNPPGLFFCPLRAHDLFRKLLDGGCRTIKVMNLMTVGPYEPPEPVWMPSVLF